MSEIWGRKRDKLWYNKNAGIFVVGDNAAAGPNSASAKADLISLADTRGGRLFWCSVRSSGNALLALARRNAGREDA